MSICFVKSKTDSKMKQKFLQIKIHYQIEQNKFKKSSLLFNSFQSLKLESNQ